jgi:hypothetical protein
MTDASTRYARTIPTLAADPRWRTGTLAARRRGSEHPGGTTSTAAAIGRLIAAADTRSGIHLKDTTAGPTPTYAEVGEGVIDFAPIVAAAEARVGRRGTEPTQVPPSGRARAALGRVAQLTHRPARPAGAAIPSGKGRS